ncbi:MAG: protein kinase [Planctomycetaceae bacterium]
MAPSTAKEFASLALRSKLLTKEQLNDLLRAWRQESKSKTTVPFARFLVNQKAITKYQAKQLSSGRTDGFFLGGCRILERLGKGGMGVVYLARQERLDRQVALKVLPSQQVPDGEALVRFQREARAVARLKHPNIVQVFDVDEHRGTHFIVMELVHGKNLADLLKEQGPFGFGKSVSLIRQAAEGLQHAHENGVVHRDIKPANLVLEGAVLKILDLGLARVESEEKVTADHSVMGTLDYMSPEQCQDTSRVDHRSDLYSLGCTWFHLLTGKAPFGDRPAAGKLLSHATQSIPSLCDRNPHLPDDVDRILQRMTARQPDDRYSDAAALAADLTALEGELLTQTVVCAPPADLLCPESAVETQTTTSRVDTIDISRSTALAATTSETDAPSSQQPTGSFLSLGYILPLMAALVLGGVYFGIHFFKDRDPAGSNDKKIATIEQAKPFAEAPATIDTPDSASSDQASEASQNSVTDIDQARPKLVETDEKPNIENTAPPSIEESSAVQETPTSSTATASPKETADVSPEPAVPPSTPTREPRESVVRSFSDGWQTDIIDGDVLTLISSETYSLNAPIRQERTFTIQGTEATRAVVFLDAARTDVGWIISDCKLTLKNVDLYVRLPETDGPFDAFRLNTSDLELIDTSLTILSDSQPSANEVSIVRLKGAREWDTTAKGEEPNALRVRMLRCFIRGPGALVRNSSVHSILSIDQSLVTGTGPVLHAIHEQERTAKHQTMELQANRCTFNTQQALVRIDCRPFTLRSVPLPITLRESIVTTMTAVAKPAPLIHWSSPIDTALIADSLSFAGERNFYSGRGPLFAAQLTSGQTATICQFPKDWQRQQLGQDLDSRIVTSQTRSLRSNWTDQKPRDFTKASGRTSKSDDAGADLRELPIPRRLRLP